MPDHPRTGIAHHDLNPFPPFGLIAMHGTLVANRLIISKRASGNTLFGIRKKPGTLPAKILACSMMGAAINSDHGSNCPGFVIHSAKFIA